MNEFVIPQIIASQLHGLPDPVRLYDPSGTMLGCFVPRVDSSLFEIEGKDLTKDELRAIEKSAEWYSTAEVLGHLETLP